MNKKFQVFISSTYEDLREERNKVRDAILSISHFPVGMELFGAASEEQWEIIKETIDTSDYYVLIVGQRYGTVIPDGPDKGISYTEKEFRYAEEKGIPILAFIIDDSVPVKAAYVEKKYTKKFDEFKTTVKRRQVTWWKNADDLAQKVTVALQNQIKRKPGKGWIRVDNMQVDWDGSIQYVGITNETQRLLKEQKELLAQDGFLQNGLRIFREKLNECRNALIEYQMKDISQEQLISTLSKVLFSLCSSDDDELE